MADTAVIEIHDTGVILATADGVHTISPAVAVLDRGDLIFGHRARAAARVNPRRTFDRFWEQLDQQPLTRAAGSAQSHADLAYFHLRSVWDDAGVTADTALLAAPAGYDSDQLALLLGIVQACGIHVGGLVAAPVAGAAAAGGTGPYLLLDAHLHRISAVRIDNQNGLNLGDVRVVARRGLAELEDALAASIAESFIQDTRFDPLHEAATEQALYDRLPQWLRLLEDNPSARLELAAGRRSYHIDIDRATLAPAVKSVYTPLVRAAADADCRVVISHRVAHLPGLRARLAEEAPAAELGAGAVARAALAHIEAIRSDAAAPAYVTRLPGPVAGAAPRPEPESTASRPTHVLCGWRAYALGDDGLELPPGKPSLARALVRADGVFLSPGGAGVALNGRTVTGEARLAPGDQIEAGGQAMRLITTATGDGAP